MTSSKDASNESQSQIDDWLDQLEEARDAGVTLAPGDLCQDPHLLELLKEQFEMLVRMQAFLADDGQAPTDSFPNAGKASAIDSKSEVLGPYKLLQRIGEGGMGTVWMAQQKEPIKRKVALKLISSGSSGKGVIARFEAERQALALMDHQNIAKIFDAGQTESGAPYFVMELVQGLPITEYCDRRKLNVPERLELFGQVCDAIQHAHTKGIIHRDIKPGNVLVSEYSGQPVVKVIDFGIAKALQADLTDRTYFTEFGQVLGTYLYMSPEQTEMNALSVDTRTDVFALGVLLYELLTGQTPISRETLATQAIPEVLKLIRSLETPKGSELLKSSGAKSLEIARGRSVNTDSLVATLQGDLDAILMKATANERERRYLTPAALQQDIQRYLGNEPIEARAPSVAYRFHKFVRRHRGPFLAATTSVAILLAGVIATSVSLAWALQEQQAKNKALLDQAAAEAEARKKVLEIREQQFETPKELMAFLLEQVKKKDFFEATKAFAVRHHYEKYDLTSRLRTLEVFDQGAGIPSGGYRRFYEGIGRLRVYDDLVKALHGWEPYLEGDQTRRQKRETVEAFVTRVVNSFSTDLSDAKSAIKIVGLHVNHQVDPFVRKQKEKHEQAGVQDWAEAYLVVGMQDHSVECRALCHKIEGSWFIDSATSRVRDDVRPPEIQLLQPPSQAGNKLNRIALAAKRHDDDLGHLPTNIRSPDGKPLLSWRVRLLPYLGHKALYDKFHLDEPWDSDHNVALLEQIPEVYRDMEVRRRGREGQWTPKLGETTFQVLVGEQLVFGAERNPRLSDVTDGTERTVLLVRVNRDLAIPWSKPTDAEFKSGTPQLTVGWIAPGDGMLVAMFDGSTHWLAAALTADEWKRVAYPSDGDKAFDIKDLSPLHHPGVRSP